MVYACSIRVAFPKYSSYEVGGTTAAEAVESNNCIHFSVLSIICVPGRNFYVKIGGKISLISFLQQTGSTALVSDALSRRLQQFLYKPLPNELDQAEQIVFNFLINY